MAISIEEATKPRAPLVTIEGVEAQVSAKIFMGCVNVPLPNDIPDDISESVRVSLAGLTLCILVMRNGTIVVGKSIADNLHTAHPGLERDVAYSDALVRAWPLEEYLARSNLTTNR